jgi:hypothetical protein
MKTVDSIKVIGAIEGYQNKGNDIENYENPMNLVNDTKTDYFKH